MSELKRTDYLNELKPPKEVISVGTKGNGWAKKVQEWLNLHRFHTPNFNLRVDIDDWFGNATAEAVKDFQTIKKLLKIVRTNSDQDLKLQEFANEINTLERIVNAKIKEFDG